MCHEPLERSERATGGGSRLVAEFFGPASAHLFGIRHVPQSSRDAGVVICSGLHGEFVRNHAREAALGRSLCSRGIPVQRFHYRGTGHGADLIDLSFHTMTEDALAAARWLMDAEGCDRVAFVGTRWGGLIAAAAASRLGTPLVLWEPALSAEHYFRELFRLARITDLREDVVHDRPGDRLDELRRLGVADILGYAMPLSLYESAHMLSLESILRSQSESLLIVAISSRGSMPARLAALATKEGSSARVDAYVVPMKEEPWWFAGGRDATEEQELVSHLVSVTSEWLDRLLEPKGAIAR